MRILIDTGASYNFICPKLAQEAGLEVRPTSNFLVKVGNGEQISSTGRCHHVQVEFPNLVIHQNFYLFPLEDSEVVLGLE